METKNPFLFTIRTLAIIIAMLYAVTIAVDFISRPSTLLFSTGVLILVFVFTAMTTSLYKYIASIKTLEQTTNNNQTKENENA